MQTTKAIAQQVTQDIDQGKSAAQIKADIDRLMKDEGNSHALRSVIGGEMTQLAEESERNGQVNRKLVDALNAFAGKDVEPMIKNDLDARAGKQVSGGNPVSALVNDFAADVDKAVAASRDLIKGGSVANG